MDHPDFVISEHAQLSAPRHVAHMINHFRTSLSAACALLLAACGPSAEHQRADSAAVALSTLHADRASQLSAQLGAQKDSLTRVVLQADDFIMHMDSSVNTVKGLPKGKRADERLDPLARQVQNRKLVMARVDALVERARTTSSQLAKSRTTNTALRAQLSSDSTMIADLNTTIHRQAAMIEVLSVRIDSLKNATMQLASSLTNAEAAHNKAYYVIGSEDELVKRGVIVREGGANLIFAHPGRTLQVARSLDPQAFTPLDQRNVRTIAVPDSTRRYRVVSRQSLDDAVVSQRDQNSFRGNLTIASASKFWTPSRYLVLVEQ